MGPLNRFDLVVARHFGIAPGVTDERYLCKPRERRTSASAIQESVLDALASLPQVDSAYPTQRVFRHATESKAALRRGRH